MLVTHGPPYGILDSAPGSAYYDGDPELLEAVERIRPRLHVFGHVHRARGMVTIDETTFVNASMLTEHGDLTTQPMFLRMQAP